jgi:hypothetical protein
VFAIDNRFGSKSFAVIREAFGKAYADKEVPCKTKILISPVSFNIMLYGLGCDLNDTPCICMSKPHYLTAVFTAVLTGCVTCKLFLSSSCTKVNIGIMHM